MIKQSVVEIKLVQVNFVPTIQETDESGGILSRRTIIGQLALDCNFLPKQLQDQLKDIIQQAYSETF